MWLSRGTKANRDPRRRNVLWGGRRKAAWPHKTRRVPLSLCSNFKVAGELFVVLGDGQRETPRVRIRHPLRVRLRFLRTRPAVVRIIQAYFSAHHDFPSHPSCPWERWLGTYRRSIRQSVQNGQLL
jgi:hypothetical protein